jgi:hypothetical protein
MVVPRWSDFDVLGSVVGLDAILVVWLLAFAETTTEQLLGD